jgi:hypothetical protein
MLAHVLGYYTRYAVICVCCFEDYNTQEGFDDDFVAIWSDDDFVEENTACDYCGIHLGEIE